MVLSRSYSGADRETRLKGVQVTTNDAHDAGQIEGETDFYDALAQVQRAQGWAVLVEKSRVLRVSREDGRRVLDTT